MPRSKARSEYLPYRVREGREPFSEKQLGEIRKALDKIGAEQHRQEFIYALSELASGFMPWETVGGYPSLATRRTGLQEVADLSNRLANAIGLNTTTVGADWNRLHGFMLDSKRQSLIDLHRDLVGLAAACRQFADDLTDEAQPPAIQKLASQLARLYLEVLRTPPTAYWPDGGTGSPYMRILSATAHAVTRKEKSRGQIYESGRLAVKQLKASLRPGE